MDNLNMLLEGANPWKSQQAESARVAAKWQKSGLLKGFGSDIERNNMAVILENQAKQLVVETNTSSGQNSMLGGTGENWAAIALPLVRRVFAEIVAKDFVSVQPMAMPSGLVFYLDFQYGNTKSPFTEGKSLYGSLADVQATDTDITNVEPTGGLYGAGRFGYSINSFSSSVLTGGTDYATASYAVAASDSLAPIVGFDSRFYGPGAATLYTMSFSDAQIATAAANPDLMAVTSWTVSGSGITAANILQKFTTYVSGAVGNNALTFVLNAQPNVTTKTATLFYNKQTTPALRGDFEADRTNFSVPNAANTTQIDIPTINIQMKSEAIVAKTRKLKAQWTPEMAQDLNAYQNIDAEAELTGLLSQYIAMEIDLEILGMLTEEAATTGYWSAVNNNVWNGSGFTQTAPTTGGFFNTQGGWFQTLGTVVQGVSNKILQKTLRGQANFMVISPQVATIMQSIPGYASDAGSELDKVFNFGSQKIGTLNSRFKVYVNPYFSNNVILMGYKGAQFLESGAVYAPYVPLLMTPLVYDPNTFVPRKGIMTRYAKKMLRPEFYGKIFVHGLSNLGVN
jgi:hypothetical protein